MLAMMAELTLKYANSVIKWHTIELLGETWILSAAAHMEFFNELQADKIKLYDDLDRLFPVSSIETIAQLPDSIDLLLIEALRRSIVKYSSQICGAEQAINEYSFKVRGVTYRVDSAQDVKTPSKLGIAMLPCDVNVDQRGRRMHEVSAKIPGTGAYSAITFNVPSILTNVAGDILKTIGVEVFSLGYSWMNTRIISALRSACNSRELYDYLRIMIPNKKLLEGLVISAGADDKDFVVLDDGAARSALSLAAQRSNRLGRSAASLALQMMLEVVPLSDSAIRDVVKQDRSVDIDLTTESYYQKGDDGFNDSLKAVWGNTVSCFPIKSAGKFLLVAFFIPQYKPELEPLLLAHRLRLRELAEKNHKAIRLNLDLANEVKHISMRNAGNIAELLGRFAGGYMNAKI